MVQLAHHHAGCRSLDRRGVGDQASGWGPVGVGMEARLSRRRTPSTKGRGIHPALLLSLALFSILAPRMAAAQTGSDTLKLVWTAPGDDGLAGKADHFEVRLST